jgi:hypothetical protein
MTGVRWVYSLFYIMIGVQTLAILAGLAEKPDFGLSPENAAFQDALTATGFVIPIMGITFSIAGSLMLFRRTAPLGIVLLAPFVVVILFTHLMLNGSPVWGITHAALLAVFAWQFRAAYAPLWGSEVESHNQ